MNPFAPDNLKNENNLTIEFKIKDASILDGVIYKINSSKTNGISKCFFGFRKNDGANSVCNVVGDLVNYTYIGLKPGNVFNISITLFAEKYGETLESDELTFEAKTSTISLLMF